MEYIQDLWQALRDRASDFAGGTLELICIGCSNGDKGHSGKRIF